LDYTCVISWAHFLCHLVEAMIDIKMIINDELEGNIHGVFEDTVLS